MNPISPAATPTSPSFPSSPHPSPPSSRHPTPHHPPPRVSARLLARHPEQPAIAPRESHGAAAAQVNQLDDLTVDLPAEHHLHHVHGFVVRHAQAADEGGFLAEALERGCDLRTASFVLAIQRVGRAALSRRSVREDIDLS